MDLPPLDGEADILAQPTRRRLLALLAELGGAAGTDALAERLGLHPNGVRNHLQQMRDAGLVIHRRVPSARGRPRDEWVISPEARPGGDPPHAYGALARWLAAAIPSSPARLREIEATGREIGFELAGGLDRPPFDTLSDVLAALGFQPELVVSSEGRVDCRLLNCPYRDAVHENRDVVCTLHRGITSGLLGRIAPAATLAAFIPHDPDTAGCEIAIEGFPTS